jgi:hypothetical protein
MANKIPTFEWNSEESGKKDFNVFEAALQSHLATHQCRFVLDNNAIAINTPIYPGPEPPGNVDAREWRKLYQTFWVEQKKFYASFDTAIGILQSMLIYPSKARNDTDIAICQRPAEIPQAEWTPEKQFQGALTKLRTSYAPRNETDTTTLRRQLQEPSDEIDGGFHEYENQFVWIYTELIKSEVPNIVGETELRECVKAGIKNDQVINHLAETIFRPDVKAQPTFEQIFAHVHGYLTFLGPDKDPYRVIKGPIGTISANKVNIVTPEKDEGGKNKKIIRSLSTDAKFCPNWENHAKPGTKWIHPSNRKQDQSAAGTPGGNQKPDPKDDQLAAARQTLKQARKFLNAAVKEAKKRKP